MSFQANMEKNTQISSAINYNIGDFLFYCNLFLNNNNVIDYNIILYYYCYQ